MCGQYGFGFTARYKAKRVDAVGGRDSCAATVVKAEGVCSAWPYRMGFGWLPDRAMVQLIASTVGAIGG